MCIGIPMRVESVTEGQALCISDGQIRPIDIRLLDGVEPGMWVLTFLGSAREVLSEARAEAIQAALQALQLVTSGPVDSASIDALFPDLAGREPSLPEHLRD